MDSRNRDRDAAGGWRTPERLEDVQARDRRHSPGQEPLKTPVATPGADTTPRRSLVRRFVAGECGLAETCWTGCLLVSVAISLLLEITPVGVTTGSFAAAVLFLATTLLHFVYGPVSLTALWRAANRCTGRALRRVLARLVTVCGAASYALTLVAGEL